MVCFACPKPSHGGGDRGEGWDGWGGWDGWDAWDRWHGTCGFTRREWDGCPAVQKCCFCHGVPQQGPGGGQVSLKYGGCPWAGVCGRQRGGGQRGAGQQHAPSAWDGPRMGGGGFPDPRPVRDSPADCGGGAAARHEGRDRAGPPHGPPPLRMRWGGPGSAAEGEVGRFKEDPPPQI